MTVGYRSSYPFGFYHDHNYPVYSNYNPVEQGYVGPRERRRLEYVLRVSEGGKARYRDRDTAEKAYGVYHAWADRMRTEIEHRPKGLADFTEEDLREEYLEGLAKMMSEPPVPLGHIGRRRAKAGSAGIRSIIQGGYY